MKHSATKSGQSPIGWKKCIKCRKRKWIQNVCRDCLDEMRRLLPPEAMEGMHNKDGRDRRCSVSWCDWDATRGSHLCVHHQNSSTGGGTPHGLPPDEMSAQDAAYYYDVSRATVEEWCKSGMEGTRKIGNRWAIKPTEWMSLVSEERQWNC